MEIREQGSLLGIWEAGYSIFFLKRTPRFNGVCMSPYLPDDCYAICPELFLQIRSVFCNHLIRGGPSHFGTSLHITVLACNNVKYFIFSIPHYKK